MANLILASKREVKSGSQMWHVYRLSENTKSDEFWFSESKPLSALRYAFLLRKRSGAIIPKSIYNKLMEAVSASKAQAEPAAPQESAPEAEQAAPTAQAVGEVEQAKFFKQFKELKAKHPEAVLLFRVGDEYRTFGEDCATLQEVCGVSSFPHHALDTWLPKLVRAGKRVAICDDITAPQAKSESAPKKKATRKSAKSESK